MLQVKAVVARGVCHTDLHCREGGIKDVEAAFEGMQTPGQAVLRSVVTL